MKESAIKGAAFGLTSGIITTLGMMVGLSSSTNSRLVVVGGILTIAIADAFSDSLGIHISEESEGKHSKKEIWTATLATFLSKLLFALTFLVPVILFRLDTAITVSIIWGLVCLAAISVWMARDQKEKPVTAVIEHLLIAMVVIVITHLVGDFIGKHFTG
jgi:vacuolar iron transporter family protein